MRQHVCVCVSGSGLILQFVVAVEKSNRPLQTHKLFIRQERGRWGYFCHSVHMSVSGRVDRKFMMSCLNLFQLRVIVSHCDRN